MAYTLIMDKEKEFAGHLVRNLEGASQHVPQQLMDLAMQVRTDNSDSFSLLVVGCICKMNRPSLWLLKTSTKKICTEHVKVRGTTSSKHMQLL